MENKIDIKLILIGALALVIIFGIVFYNTNKIQDHKDEITKLHQQNDSLYSNIIRINNINKVLDVKIDSVSGLISTNNQLIVNTQSQIIKLKTKQNEISNTISSMSASTVASSLSDYLNKTSKSSNDSI